MKINARSAWKPIAAIVLVLALAACTQSGNTDAVLDDLESICDQSIVAAGKMQRGDMSAMSDMAQLTAKYQSLGNKLEAAKGQEWTAAQQQRYMRILDKYSRAMSRM